MSLVPGLPIQPADAWDSGPAAAVLALLEPPAWHARAACRGMGTATFYPDGDEARADRLRAARQVCETCPVTAECADAAAREEHGIWAGLTPRQRADRRAGRRYHRACVVCGAAFDTRVSNVTVCDNPECRRAQRAERARRKRGAA